MRGGGEQRGTASEAGINAPFGMELPPQKSLQASTAAVEATADSAAAATTTFARVHARRRRCIFVVYLTSSATAAAVPPLAAFPMPPRSQPEPRHDNGGGVLISHGTLDMGACA